MEAITVICEFKWLREYYAIRRYGCGVMVEFGNVNAYVNHRGTPPFQKSLILLYPPAVIHIDLIDISTLGCITATGDIQQINNSDKGSGNTLRLSSQSYR